MEIKRLIVGPLLTNCYLLFSNQEAMVVDPGGGLEEILKELGGKKIKYIILTHYHWDHTLVAQKLKEKNGGEILIHEKDKKYLKFKPDRTLVDGEEIKIGKEILKVVHTPGHSSGSISLLGENFIFTGDTIFQDGVGRTDLPGGSEGDLINSLAKLKEIIKPKMKIYPGHGDPFVQK